MYVSPPFRNLVLDDSCWLRIVEDVFDIFAFVYILYIYDILVYTNTGLLTFSHGRSLYFL